MMAINLKWGMFKDILKEIVMAIMVLLVAAGLALFAYMAGQAHTRTYIDSYIMEECGEVPAYHKIGDGISAYYIETKLTPLSAHTPCERGDEFVVWTIPKK